MSNFDPSRGRLEIDPESGVDDIASVLLNREVHEIQRANSRIVPVLPKLAELTEALLPQTDKLKERRRICDKIYQRVTKCRERTRLAEEAYNKAIQKMNRRRNMRSVICDEIARIEREIGSWKEILSAKEAEYGTTEISHDNLVPKAREFTSLAELTSSSVVVIGTESPMYRWTTSDIYIKDSDGTVLPFNFGSFDIEVRESNGALDIKVVAVDPDERQGYPHPHVNSDGHPCLGTASNLIMRCLLHRDIPGLIRIVDSYLTNYNPDSPYVVLREWVPNRYDLGVCPACQGAHSGFCQEHFCTSCGLQVTDPEELSGCGTCRACCQQHHLWCAQSAADRTGINGTGCQPAALFERHTDFTVSRTGCRSGNSLLYCERRQEDLICQKCVTREREESSLEHQQGP